MFKNMPKILLQGCTPPPPLKEFLPKLKIGEIGVNELQHCFPAFDSHEFVSCFSGNFMHVGAFEGKEISSILFNPTLLQGS